MKPTTLLSCLFAVALSGAVSAEEPGRPERGGPERPAEGGRPPERREEAGRDKPRERAAAPDAGRREPGRPQGDKHPGAESHPDKMDHPRAPHAGREGMKPHHEARGPHGDPRAHHVLEAIKHLHAAGLHEVAGLLEAKVKRPSPPGPGHPGGPGPRHMEGHGHGMKKAPVAHQGRPGPGPGADKRGPRPEADKKPEGRPEGAPQRG